MKNEQISKNWYYADAARSYIWFLLFCCDWDFKARNKHCWWSANSCTMICHGTADCTTSTDVPSCHIPTWGTSVSGENPHLQMRPLCWGGDPCGSFPLLCLWGQMENLLWKRIPHTCLQVRRGELPQETLSVFTSGCWEIPLQESSLCVSASAGWGGRVEEVLPCCCQKCMSGGQVFLQAVQGCKSRAGTCPRGTSPAPHLQGTQGNPLQMNTPACR